MHIHLTITAVSGPQRKKSEQEPAKRPQGLQGLQFGLAGTPLFSFVAAFVVLFVYLYPTALCKASGLRHLNK